MPDPYYSRPEVSNSKLTWIKQFFMPPLYYVDLLTAYKNGTLVDCMITETHKVDYYKRRIDEYVYTVEEMERGKRMRDAFWRHPLCREIAEKSQMQRITVVNNFQIEYGHMIFSLDVRCKWDLFVEHFDMAADIKTTCCKTEKQFRQTVLALDYDRQGAWYLDLEGRENFVIMGISKHPPHEIFIVPMKRGDKLYTTGKEKYQELSFRHHCLL